MLVTICVSNYKFFLVFIHNKTIILVSISKYLTKDVLFQKQVFSVKLSVFYKN